MAVIESNCYSAHQPKNEFHCAVVVRMQRQIFIFDSLHSPDHNQRERVATLKGCSNVNHLLQAMRTKATTRYSGTKCNGMGLCVEGLWVSGVGDTSQKCVQLSLDFIKDLALGQVGVSTQGPLTTEKYEWSRLDW